MTRTAIPLVPRWWPNPLAESKDPERRGRKLHVMQSIRERRRSIGAHARAVLDENELPALADIHLRLERHGDAVRARPVGQRHLFHADDAARSGAGRDGSARAPFEPRAQGRDHRAFARPLQQSPLEPVVVAHELGGEQSRRLLVELGRRSLLLDRAGVSRTMRSAIAIASIWSWVTSSAESASETMSSRSQARASSRSLASRLDSGSSSRMTAGS